MEKVYALYIDLNYPGEAYIINKTVEKLFVNEMRSEGAALRKVNYVDIIDETVFIEKDGNYFRFVRGRG